VNASLRFIYYFRTQGRLDAMSHLSSHLIIFFCPLQRHPVPNKAHTALSRFRKTLLVVVGGFLAIEPRASTDLTTLVGSRQFGHRFKRGAVNCRFDR